MSAVSVKPQPSQRPGSPTQERTLRTPEKAPAAQSRPVDPAKLGELTSKIAYELYEKRGRVDGHDVEDWFEAEKIAKARPIV